jgi:8-oxo-dGTP diphosphatase
LGLAYAAVVPDDSLLHGETGQPPAWVPLTRAWEGAFPEDLSRIRDYARSLSRNIPDAIA